VAARLGLRRFWFFGERKEKDLPQRSQRKAHGGHGEMGVRMTDVDDGGEDLTPEGVSYRDEALSWS
jgi:hypothetical protein